MTAIDLDDVEGVFTIRWLSSRAFHVNCPPGEAEQVHEWAREKVFKGNDLHRVGWGGEAFVGEFWRRDFGGRKVVLTDQDGDRVVDTHWRFLCMAEMPPLVLIDYIREFGKDAMAYRGIAEVEVKGDQEMVTYIDGEGIGEMRRMGDRSGVRI